jgi:hypothetical protein
MGARRLTPIFTENFAENLEAIRAFLGQAGQASFGRLPDGLFADLAPTLCQFPLSGRPLLGHDIRSLETRTAARPLRRLLRPGDDLREFILDDYLLLYVVRQTQVIFLSIKHHRQLSFDLHHFWA